MVRVAWLWSQQQRPGYTTRTESHACARLFGCRTLADHGKPLLVRRASDVTGKLDWELTNVVKFDEEKQLHALIFVAAYAFARRLLLCSPVHYSH